MKRVVLFMLLMSVAIVGHCSFLCFKVDADEQIVSPETKVANFQKTLKLLINEADQLSVSGAHVGRGASPGRFYLLVNKLRKNGDLKKFKALSEHKHVVVRAAAMYCLVQTYPKQARAILLKRVKSKVSLTYQPGGCGLMKISEGDLVKNFIANVNCLEGLKPKKALP